MKRLFTLFTGLCVMLLAGCNDEYDDSALVKRLDDFEQRLERLERLCNDMNTNLGSMQTIVTALDRGDYITSVEPLTENGSMVGYTIRFAKGTPIVVYNGKPGTAPVVSVKKDTDGIYYWTLDGEWITDGGKKLPVSGQDGTSPKLKIEEEYWYISYDDGTTWTKLDKATGEGATTGGHTRRHGRELRLLHPARRQDGHRPESGRAEANRSPRCRTSSTPWDRSSYPVKGITMPPCGRTASASCSPTARRTVSATASTSTETRSMSSAAKRSAICSTTDTTNPIR